VLPLARYRFGGNSDDQQRRRSMPGANSQAASDRCPSRLVPGPRR